MKAILLSALAAFFSSGVFADAFIFRVGNESLTLTNDACPAKVLQIIEPEYREVSKHAVAVIGGKQEDACWMFHKGVIYVGFEDGAQSEIPAEMFKREPGA